MEVQLKSPCKVNLILNILAKREDGFHELETVMYPVGLHDHLTLSHNESGIEFSCNNPELPTDSGNLVVRAAASFLKAAKLEDGVKIHLEKNVPVSAGLGGGSSNAAVTLTGLNELFGKPLSEVTLVTLASELGSDVPFFLQERPALATGRGEAVVPLERFTGLEGKQMLLIHPRFGVSTAWAYRNLARFPDAVQGKPGRALRLARSLQENAIDAEQFYNSLEWPVFEKYPLLAMFKEFLQTNGALVAMMSGSGSTTFAILPDRSESEALEEKFVQKFGSFCWIKSVSL